MKRRNPEAQLQGTVFAYLRAALPSRAIVFHCPNGGSRDKREAARLKWQGVVPGIPDLIVLLDGRCYGIELKAPKGTLSAEQKAMADRFVENDCAWTVARSLEQVEAWLRGLGVPLKARVAVG